MEFLQTFWGWFNAIGGHEFDNYSLELKHLCKINRGKEKLSTPYFSLPLGEARKNEVIYILFNPLPMQRNKNVILLIHLYLDF